MTERQRKKLEWLGSNASAGYVLDDNDRCEIRAALADLDAATKALRPTANRLRTLRGRYAGAIRSDLTVIYSPAEADAVLAVAGKEQP